MIPNPLSFLLSLRYTITAATTRARPSSSTETPSKETRTASIAIAQVTSARSSSSTSFLQRITGTSSNAVSRVSINPSSPTKEDRLSQIDKYRSVNAGPTPTTLPGVLVSAASSSSSSSSKYQKNTYRRPVALDLLLPTISEIRASDSSSSSSSITKNRRIHHLPQFIVINILHFFRPHEVFPCLQRVSKLWRFLIQSDAYRPRVFEVDCLRFVLKDPYKEREKEIAITEKLPHLLSTKFRHAQVINLLCNDSMYILDALLHQRVQMPAVRELILYATNYHGENYQPKNLFRSIDALFPNVQKFEPFDLNVTTPEELTYLQLQNECEPVTMDLTPPVVPRAPAVPIPPASRSSSSTTKRSIDNLSQSLVIAILHFFRPHEVFPHLQRISKLWRYLVQSDAYHPQVFEISCPRLWENPGSEREKEIDIAEKLPLLRTKFNRARVINLFRNDSLYVINVLLHQNIQIPTLQTLILHGKNYNWEIYQPTNLCRIIATMFPCLQNLALHNLNITPDKIEDLQNFSTLTSLTINQPERTLEAGRIYSIANRNRNLKNLNLPTTFFSQESDRPRLILRPSQLNEVISILRQCCPAFSSLIVYPLHYLQKATLNALARYGPFPTLTYCSAPWRLDPSDVKEIAVRVPISFPHLRLSLIIPQTGPDVEPSTFLSDLQAQRGDYVDRLELENFHYASLTSFPELTYLSLSGSFSSELLPNLTSYFPKLLDATLKHMKIREEDLSCTFADHTLISHPNLQNLTISIGPFLIGREVLAPPLSVMDYGIFIRTLFHKSPQLLSVKCTGISITRITELEFFGAGTIFPTSISAEKRDGEIRATINMVNMLVRGSESISWKI